MTDPTLDRLVRHMAWANAAVIATLAGLTDDATEHRAQIAGALSTNGIDALDLDELDLWAYSNAEGLGA
jgi:hypothetical protein